MQGVTFALMGLLLACKPFDIALRCKLDRTREFGKFLNLPADGNPSMGEVRAQGGDIEDLCQC